MADFTKQTKVREILDNVNKVIVGKEDVAKLVLTAMLSRGHVLLEDVPGTGKTMLAKTFAKTIDCDFKRIQFTPDLLPSDITGLHIFNQKNSDFEFREGPVFANIVLADEINRATPRTQSALLECMQESQITVDGTEFKLKAPFMVLATQNPIETAGTYRLPEAELDRFLIKTSVGYPVKNEEINIINNFSGRNPLDEIHSVVSADELLLMIDEAEKVFIHPSIVSYIVDIINATRNQSNVSIGVSTRGSLALVSALKSYAYISGRDYVIPEDVDYLAPAVLAHRLVLKAGQVKNDNREDIIRNCVKAIEVPTEDWKR